MEDINFFNIKKAKEYRSFQKYFFILPITICINVVIYTYFSYKIHIASNYIKELNSSFSNIENKGNLDQKLKINEDLIFLETQNKILNGEVINSLNSKIKIKSILENLPKEVFINDLDISTFEINISGNSKYKESIYKYYKNLRLLEYSSEISLSEISERGSFYYYNINIEIR